ncbi:MAG: mercury methylation ferredoxin HgcB [bacterium]|nr:mercury methylation ferredoxin HgcB [bacterium]
MKYLANVTTLELERDLCNGCGMCAVVCPHAVFSLDNGRARIDDRDACMECGACSLNCPEGAIFVQTGVGCAQAVINTALGRKGACSCTLEDYSRTGSDCGSMNVDCGSAEDACGCGPASGTDMKAGCGSKAGDCGCDPKPGLHNVSGCC